MPCFAPAQVSHGTAYGAERTESRGINIIMRFSGRMFSVVFAACHANPLARHYFQQRNGREGSVDG
eukprot:3386064-Rhodomonas_salina.1